MENLNLLATFLGAVAAFLFGWIIYSPAVFGRRWAEGSRVELGSAASMPVMAMVTQFLALFALAFVIGITATLNMLITAILAILAAALFVVSGGAFIMKSSYALMIDGGYVLGAGVIMILAQGIL